MGPALREGLTGSGAATGGQAVALAARGHRRSRSPATVQVVGFDGGPHHHEAAAADRRRRGAAHREDRRPPVAPHCRCGSPDCDVRVVVASPLVEGDTVVGALAAYGPSASALLVRAVDEVARWVSTQLELAAAEPPAGPRRRGRAARAAGADQPALRLQHAHRGRVLHPHRSRPRPRAAARVRRLHPVRAAQRRAAGDASPTSCATPSATSSWSRPASANGCAVRLRVAPEVLPVAVPFLVVQPLVENAVRHGLAGDAGRVTVTITAADDGADAVLDRGGRRHRRRPGGRSRRASSAAAGRRRDRGVGLGNVDARLRSVFGDAVRPGRRDRARAPAPRSTVRVPKSAPTAVGPVTRR